MIITFTGHRNCTVADSDLDAIRAEFPGALWLQGGAAGVDRAVWDYAKRNGVKRLTIRPDYQQNGGKYAPLMRNMEMVDASDLVVAVWDGREYGGTYHTVNYARESGVPVRVIAP